MYDRIWTTRTPLPGETLQANGLTIRCEAAGGASLVSGDLDAAIRSLAPEAPVLGLLDDTPTGAYALRIARDRALLCTEAPLGLDGWRDGFAVSSADDLFLQIRITGDRAADLRSACMSGGRGSASTAILFAGQSALVVSVPEGICVRVQAPDAAALWAHLEKLRHAL